jgi:hypothetical protein
MPLTQRGYVRGALVRRAGAGGQHEDAVIVRVYPWGALDVDAGGVSGAWWSSTCQPVLN